MLKSKNFLFGKERDKNNQIAIQRVLHYVSFGKVAVTHNKDKYWMIRLIFLTYVYVPLYDAKMTRMNYEGNEKFLLK